MLLNMAGIFEEDRKQFDQMIKNIEQFENSYVLIGFQEGSVTKSQVKGNRRKEPGKSMAQIASDNEYGTRSVPQRSFMRTSFDENRDLLVRVINAEYDKVVQGTSTVKKSLNAIGLLGVDLVQQKIRSIYVPPNSARTIAIKKSSKPLIDFGQMIQSVRHKVVMP